MLKPHKHATIIKAWANGAEIEVKATAGNAWYNCPAPMWWEESEYRVKPEKKTDVFEYGFIVAGNPCTVLHAARHKANYDNIKFTFDGETGKLKAVELI